MWERTDQIAEIDMLDGFDDDDGSRTKTVYLNLDMIESFKVCKTKDGFITRIFTANRGYNAVGDISEKLKRLCNGRQRFTES